MALYSDSTGTFTKGYFLAQSNGLKRVPLVVLAENKELIRNGQIAAYIPGIRRYFWTSIYNPYDPEDIVFPTLSAAENPDVVVEAANNPLPVTGLNFTTYRL